MGRGRPGLAAAQRIIAQRIIAQLHPGAIILLHDWVPGTIAALPAILAAIQARGLRAVTLPQLLHDAGLVRGQVP